MIYTFTLNPSVDYYIKTDDLKTGEINRFDEYRYVAAGKGINCSKILDLFNTPSTAVYFSGRATGEFIDRDLQNYACINTHQIRINEATRINVKILGVEETALNSGGPHISEEAKDELLSFIDQLEADDYAIISGSLPRNVSVDYVRDMCRLISEKGSRLILDVPDFRLSDFAGLDIWLIKPNIDELRNILGNKDIDYGNYHQFISVLHEAGIRNVLISLGEYGSCFSGEAGRFLIRVPEVTVFSTVGAGDSLLASFVGEVSKGKTVRYALITASAASAAMVMTEELPSLELIDQLISKIEIIQED